MTTTTAYLGLGSNLGDREAALRGALERLSGPHLRITRRSALYETAPRDLEDQPSFLNMAVELETTLSARELLARVREVEAALGRERLIPKGPRTIDIDILLFGAAIIADAPELEIPHPRMAHRRFVLEPLAEIAPDLVHPLTGQRIAAMLKAVAGQRVRRVLPPLP